jgi:pyroglutamyl-peptidase
MVYNNAQPVITGFLPFLGETFNPSQQLAVDLATELGASSLILPVKYADAWPILKNYLEQQKDFRFCLMLGQAGGRKKIGLERCSLNIEHAEAADEAGVVAQEKVIIRNGPEILQATLPLIDFKNQLVGQGHPVEVSHSAGTFVCNSLYYQALYWAQQNHALDRMLFVHIPHQPAQVGEQLSALRDLAKLIL